LTPEDDPTSEFLFWTGVIFNRATLPNKALRERVMEGAKEAPGEGLQSQRVLRCEARQRPRLRRQRGRHLRQLVYKGSGGIAIRIDPVDLRAFWSLRLKQA
ncbi:MAG: hypothetical protein ACHP7O_12795, partial [Burkholderiales bacterium]